MYEIAIYQTDSPSTKAAWAATLSVKVNAADQIIVEVTKPFETNHYQHILECAMLSDPDKIGEFFDANSAFSPKKVIIDKATSSIKINHPLAIISFLQRIISQYTVETVPPPPLTPSLYNLWGRITTPIPDAKTSLQNTIELLQATMEQERENQLRSQMPR